MFSSLFCITLFFFASFASAADYVYNVKCSSSSAKPTTVCGSRNEQIFKVIKSTTDSALQLKDLDPVDPHAWTEITSNHDKDNSSLDTSGCSAHHMHACDQENSQNGYDDSMNYSVNNCGQCSSRNLRRSRRQLSRQELDSIEQEVAWAVHVALSKESLNVGKSSQERYPKPCAVALAAIRCEVRMAPNFR